MSRYHINPKTDMPGRCTAKPGNCPYGGNEKHYGTYSEAFEVSQENLKILYKLLPKNLTELDSETQNAINEQEKEQQLLDVDSRGLKPKEDLFLKRNEIMETDDPEFLLKVLDGSLDKNANWGLISGALKNEFLPREVIDEALYTNFDKHHPYYIKYLMYSPNLTNKDLKHILKNTDDDEVKLLVYIHKNFDKETIMDYIENKPDLIIKYPYHGMLENKTHRSDPDIRQWRLDLVKKGISPFFPENDRIYSKYMI